MNTKYMTVSAVLLAATVVHAELVSEWRAGADINTNGAPAWTDSVNGNDLGFDFPDAGNLVSVSGEAWGNAYSFGGAGDPLRALNGSAHFQGLTDASVAILFNADNLNTNTVLYSEGGTGSGFSLTLDSSGALRVLLKDGSTGADAKINLTGGSLSAGNWYHAVVTIDGLNDNVQLYLDGAQIAGETATTFGDFTGNNHTAIAGKNGSQLGGGDLDLGGDQTDDYDYYETFTGDIALAQVYNTALTSGEVSALYASIPEPTTLGLIAFSSAGILIVRRKFMM